MRFRRRVIDAQNVTKILHFILSEDIRLSGEVHQFACTQPFVRIEIKRTVRALLESRLLDSKTPELADLVTQRAQRQHDVSARDSTVLQYDFGRRYLGLHTTSLSRR